VGDTYVVRQVTIGATIDGTILEFDSELKVLELLELLELLED
jgi:hypothetical protein